MAIAEIVHSNTKQSMNGPPSVKEVFLPGGQRTTPKTAMSLTKSMRELERT
jgi:hypothetical protein